MTAETAPDGFVTVAPGYYRADGSTHPDAIEAADFVPALQGRVLGKPVLELGLADAAALARMLHDERRERIVGANRHRAVVAAFCDGAPDPERNGDAINQHLAAERDRTNRRWSDLLGTLSGGGRSALESMVAQDVVPGVQAIRIDHVLLWHREPDQLVRMLKSSCDPPPPVEHTIEQTDRAVIVSTSYSAASNDQALATLSRSSLFSYAQLVERALINELVADHEIDLSTQAREQLAGDFADEQTHKGVEARPAVAQRAARVVEALKSVQAGSSAQSVFDEFDLAEAGFDLETWRKYSQNTSPERAARRFAHSAELDPATQRAELLAGPIVTHALLERALAPIICPAVSVTGPDPFPCRPDWLVECLAEARDWYVAEAQARVPDGPERWTEWLQLFRP